ncbi:multidrug effflux MFS transporter [Mesorhizobium sp. KR1-2]|uniref:multidrug effflux MFS transporter n=1 Tax=Mesorhizobium sp. KR1-2 TaxID=3156609 RepID=UPI0032B3A23A
MASKFLSRATAPHILTLVTAAAASSLCMNIFVPSLPGMARHFEADYAVVQLVVSLYLAATAVLQVFIGPASDRFGRRPVMLACFAIFIAGTVAALYAPTIEFLLGCRLLQAFSAAGAVLARAVVRDTVEAAQAASKIGYITMGMSLAPMIGPIVGGFLEELYGWQSTFLLMLAVGVFAFAIVWLDLGETNRGRSPNLLAQFRAYPELLGSQRFWGYTLTAVFTSGGFYAFLGGGPYIASEMLHLTASQYGVYFAIVSVGYMLGNFLSGRFSPMVGINRMMLSGNVVIIGGMVLSILLFLLGYNHPLSLFGPTLFIGIGNGVTLPNANAGIVGVSAHLAGSASGLGGALTIGGGAALAVLSGAMLSPETGPYPLLWLMLLSSVAGMLCTLYVMRAAPRAAEAW